MSLNLGIMSAAVTLDDKDYRNTLAGLESTSQKSFSKIAAYAASYLSLRAISQFAISTIKTYSDLEEETNKFSVVFAGLGSQTSRILKQMRDDFGLSELAAKRMLAGTGDMLTGFGFDKDVALALSEGAAKLGADIASFSNYAGGAEGATSALTKAMLGEAESAKLLGVVIRQDSDEYKDLVKQAMTTGVTIDALGKTFKVQSEQQAKAVAALALAYQQSPNAIGDFVRSQDSIANQQRILQNNFEQLTATIGGDLAPAYKTIVTSANSLLSAYNNLSPVARGLTNDVIAFSAALLVLNKTKFGANVKKFFSDLTASNETKKIAAQEALKRAEIKKTDAVYEAIFARQKLRLAEKTKADAEAAVAAIKFQKMEAEAKGDVAAIAAATAAEAKARMELTKATLEASKAEQTYHAKRAEATVATQEYRDASAALAPVLSTVSVAANAAGVAAMFSATAFKAAAAAVKAFFVNLGPIGWALIAAGAAYTAVSAAITSYNDKLDENIKKTSEVADKANELADANNKETTATLNNLDRLQELAQYERLSNAEKEEAIKLLEAENIAYDKNGSNVNEMIRLNGGETGSLKKLTAARKEELKQRRLALLQDQLKKNQDAMAAASTDAENAGKADLYQKKIKEIHEEIKRLNEDEKNLGKTQEDRAKLTVEEAKKQRAAIKSIEAQEFELELDRSSAEKQVQLINDEINKIFQRQSGKYKNVDDFMSADLGKLSTKELEDTKKILDLEKRRADIKKQAQNVKQNFEEQKWNMQFDAVDSGKQVQLINDRIKNIFAQYSKKFGSIDKFTSFDTSKLNDKELEAVKKIIDLEKQRADIKKRSSEYFKREQEDFQKYLADRQRDLAAEKIEKQIRKKQKLGDDSGAMEIMRQQLVNAEKAAAAMKRQYDIARTNAQKDGVSTKEEEKKIEQLKAEVQRLMSEGDRWKSRIDSETEKAEDANRQTVGSFSLAALQSMLGASKPEQQTAKNTKKTVELLGKMNEQLGNGSMKYNE